MRKFLVLVVALMLMSSLVVGCGGDAGSSENGSSPAQTEGKSQESKSMSIDKIRQATVDAGYEVTDDYMDAFMDDVPGDSRMGNTCIQLVSKKPSYILFGYLLRVFRALLTEQKFAELHEVTPISGTGISRQTSFILDIVQK
jgi:hypothetical protein